MEPTILDTNLQAIGVLDKYISFIWTDRYDSYGDFQIYTHATQENLDLLKENYYLYIPDSDHIMIIEDIQIDTDVEEGNHLTVTGRSLESILDRRIIWNRTTLSGSLQDAIKKLLNENIINPSITNRKISNFIFSESTDTVITSLTTEGEYLGETLYEVIEALCYLNDIGFKITLNDSNQFVFSLYAGVDRSYHQLEKDYVVFAPNLDNLINTNYIQSNKTMKTVTLIGGQQDYEKTTTDDEEGTTTTTIETKEVFTTKAISSGEGSGLNRREIYTDASFVSSQKEDETYMSDDQFKLVLQEEGTLILSENTYTKAFDGEIDNSSMFTYGKDFFMGDMVQIESEFGDQGRSRVIEIVRSQDENGYSIYPTFSAID